MFSSATSHLSSQQAAATTLQPRDVSQKTTLFADGYPVGIRRLYSIFHIRDGRLPLIVTDLSSAIHMNDTDAWNSSFGIVRHLVIPCKGVGATQPDEDILLIRRVVQEIGSRILVHIRHQIDRAHAQV